MTATLTSSVASAKTYRYRPGDYVSDYRAIRFDSDVVVIRAEQCVPQLSNAKLLKFAATHRPPQSWYDEDMEGLW
jgi:hypothetical protein